MQLQPSYDVVITGSGLGGLVCAAVLAKNGYSVCVIEKNRQIGGCLQTFSRDKAVLDTGVHYIGGLAEGQQLHQVFKYLGIMDKLRLQRLDKDGFDHILFRDDPVAYPLAQVYENFIAQLSHHFPREEQAIRKYCSDLRETCSKFPLYNLRVGDYSEKQDVPDMSVSGYLQSVTTNKKLQQVLAGNNLLYAGEADKTPFYIHALITNSFIESAWKCIDGGSQIAKHLGRTITAHGGTIVRNATVTTIEAGTGTAEYVTLEDGRRIAGRYFISNLHPATTVAMTRSNAFRKVYRNRMNQLENSTGPFLLNIILKKNTFPYLNHNVYYHDTENAWAGVDYTAQNWPLTYALFVNAGSKNDEYADSLTIMTYMRYADVAQWAATFNTDSRPGDRGSSYTEFKKERAETLLRKVYERFPQLRECLLSYHAATPLSYRDYQGTADGSMYGIAKDYRNPFTTFIAPKTKVPNLILTGQNLNLHGILGVTLSALMTCSELTDQQQLIKDINNA